ncbi:MAG: hypothetical protein ABSG40_13400 [Terriglobales bacterium]|jgi:hypothetical protein
MPESGKVNECNGDVTTVSTDGLAFAMNQWDNEVMKQHDGARHAGPMRVMSVDAEFAGIIVAVGFLVMGAIGLDIGKWFVLGALVLGAVVALLLRFTRKE